MCEAISTTNSGESARRPLQERPDEEWIVEAEVDVVIMFSDLDSRVFPCSVVLDGCRRLYCVEETPIAWGIDMNRYIGLVDHEAY